MSRGECPIPASGRRNAAISWSSHTLGTGELGGVAEAMAAASKTNQPLRQSLLGMVSTSASIKRSRAKSTSAKVLELLNHQPILLFEFVAKNLQLSHKLASAAPTASA